MSETNDEVVEDILTAHQIVLKYLPEEIPLKGVFVNSLYAILKSKTDVNESVKGLRDSIQFKFLNCSGHSLNDLFMVSTENYLKDVDIEISNLDATHKCLDIQIALRRFSRLAKSTSSMSVTSKDLIDSHTLTRDEIEILLSQRWLSRVGVQGDLINFSHPKLGWIVQSLETGSKLITSYISKRKFKEVDECRLVSESKTNESVASNQPRKLLKVSKSYRSSKLDLKEGCQPLGIHYHLFNLEGSGSLTRQTAPGGKVLLKLTQNRST